MISIAEQIKIELFGFVCVRILQLFIVDLKSTDNKVEH